MTLLPGQDQEKAPPIHADPAAFIGAAGVDSLPAFWRRGARADEAAAAAGANGATAARVRKSVSGWVLKARRIILPRSACRRQAPA